MRYAYSFLGAAAMVAAAPASSSSPAMDFNAILTAAGPSLTGAPTDAAVLAQTAVYNQASATSAAAAAATGVATAVATASVAARDLEQKRAICIFGFCFGSTSSSTSTSATATTTTKATSTTAGLLGGVTAVVTTAAGAVGGVLGVTSLVSVSVPSTCTPVSWTNTNAFITTDTSCPQPYEVGTYCGFINPEDPCAPQPGGWGPVVVPDTAAQFLANAPFVSAAVNAPVPTGYANTFKNYNASVNANSYLGMHTLASYDVAGCAGWCDNTTLCTAFNIYIERDPAWNPDQCSCQNTASLTNFVCTLWGSGVEPAAAVNQGGWRDAFQVVIAASNGYEKSNTTTPTTPSGWTNPQNCSSSAHSHPSTCISQKFFPGPFDVSVCSAYANAQNSVNQNVLASLWAKLTGSYNPSKCNFFNAYLVKQDGVAKGTYCSLFAQQYSPSQATYQPGWNNKKYYGVETSWSYCSK